MIWYSYKGIPYSGNCPPYYNLDTKLWFNKLQATSCEIKEATETYLAQEGITIEQYFNTQLIEGKQSWKISPFIFWGNRNEVNCKKGKSLVAHFETIEGLVGLAISILPPNTLVKPHYGDTDAVYRMHIPIQIPAGLPTCGLMVHGEQKSWESSTIITFCDAHLHQAWNYSPDIRIVIIADVLRPELINQKMNICLNVLSLLQLQRLETKFPFILSLPALIRGALRLLLKSFLYFKA